MFDQLNAQLRRLFAIRQKAATAFMKEGIYTKDELVLALTSEDKDVRESAEQLMIEFAEVDQDHLFRMILIRKKNDTSTDSGNGQE